MTLSVHCRVLLDDALPPSWAATLLRRSFGLLKTVGEEGYELEVSSAQGWHNTCIFVSERTNKRHHSFIQAGSTRLALLRKSFGLLKTAGEEGYEPG
jgi:hypothetical protein